jgi:hypothetical protein
MPKTSPGPLPNDGDRIRPAVDLANFVKGTEVYDLDNDSFNGAQLSFVHSATEPPTGAQLSRASAWFKRGEGRLKYYFVFTPVEGPDSGATQAMWLDASDRRQIAADYRYPILVGAPLQVDSTATEVHSTLCSHGYNLLKVAASTFSSLTDCSITSDAGASLWHYWQERPHDPIFVAPFSSSSYSGGVYKAVHELGFCTAFVETGYSGPGHKLMLKAKVARAGYLKMASQDTCPIDEGVVAITTDSRVSISNYRRIGIFKYGAMTHRPF